ncbi:hypothetical protein [Rhodococcus sp. SGAir0479]|uniref:hypothetical protein n=1 Tax=Rhodococcus sp. SGAir0479 TaxID=2567884 RepID=UPI0010CCBA40|nr:hypothetical protein [Rhodococcus sp. SGAir0479]QCQ91737.1 hypothetical protein E7742_11170 [Rhodococcus sp. SGAir0479]
MTAVTTPVEGYTGIVAGVAFINGRGETDDHNALSYFARHGYRIGDAAAVPALAVPKIEINRLAPEIPEGAPNDKWKVPALKAYAGREGIDLDGAKNKDEILAAIAAHEVAADADLAADVTAAGEPDDDSGDA